MKYMGLFAKVSGIFSFGLVYLLFSYIVKMEFTRSEEIFLYMRDGKCFFYCTEPQMVYNKGQEVIVELDGMKYEKIGVEDVALTDFTVDGNSVFCCRLSDELYLGEEGVAKCRLYTEFDSFIDYVLCEMRDN